MCAEGRNRTRPAISPVALPCRDTTALYLSNGPVIRLKFSSPVSGYPRCSMGCLGTAQKFGQGNLTFYQQFYLENENTGAIPPGSARSDRRVLIAGFFSGYQ